MDYKVALGSTIARITFLGDSQVHAIVDSLGNVNRLFDLAVLGTFTAAGHTWISVNAACSVTVTAHLLDHEGTLPNRLETLTLTATTSGWLSARLSFGPFARWARVSPIEVDCLLGTLHSF